jgi:hypothetical protein
LKNLVDFLKNFLYTIIVKIKKENLKMTKKQKQAKALALQIADLENIIKNSDDKNEVYQAQMKVIQLMEKVDDIVLLEEYLQEFLKNI